MVLSGHLVYAFESAGVAYPIFAILVIDSHLFPPMNFFIIGFSTLAIVLCCCLQAMENSIHKSSLIPLIDTIPILSSPELFFTE